MATIVQQTNGEKTIYTADEYVLVNQKLGDLTKLNTVDKTSLVNAINGNAAQLADIALNACFPPAPLSAISTSDTDIGPKLQAILNYSKTNGNTPIIIPEGYYYLKSTVTVMSYQKILAIGNVTIDIKGFNNIAFRIKNDDTLSNQGYDSSYNTHSLDAQGVLFIWGDKTAGSVGINIGNDTSYSGSHFSAFSGAKNVVIASADIGIQRTNNNAFCIRWENVRVSGCNTNFQVIQSSNIQSGELDTFNHCFFNNAVNKGLEFLNGGEFAFEGCSIDVNHLPVRIANPNNSGNVVLHFTNCHLEKSDNVFFDASSAGMQAIVNLNNVTFIPSQYSVTGNVHHTLFKGNIRLNENNIHLPTDTYSQDPSGLFLCDDSVVTYKKLITSGSTFALTSKKLNKLINNDFSNGLTGFTVVSGSWTPTTSKHYTGTQSVLINGTGYMELDTPKIRVNDLVLYVDMVFNASQVTAGSFNITPYYYDISGNQISSSTPLNIPLTSLSTDTFYKAQSAFMVNLPVGTDSILFKLSTSSGFSGSLYLDSFWVE